MLILKIDAEGYDPLVLLGARHALAKRVFAIITFEYHGKYLWGKTPLSRVINDLAYSGYICYFDGRPILTRVTGCWVDWFTTTGWSNIVCAVSGTQFHDVLETMSFMTSIS